jgi:TonB family protein
MTDTKDNSSLPLLLSITGAVLAVAGGGWYFLNQEPEAPIPETEAAPTQQQTLLDPDGPGGAKIPMPAQSSIDVEAELRKARLAADADILVRPTTQSALHYYGRVLKADPRHEVANAELATILARVAQTVEQHLEAEEYEDAYKLASQVATLRPEHDLVVVTQTTLDAYTEELVTQAISYAQDGNDSDADEALATAAGLPGRNPEYFTAVGKSINEIRDVRLAAEADREQRAKLAADEARQAWTDSVRNAIGAGNLITPAGASARDLLAENNSWSFERATLTGEFVAAMFNTAAFHIGESQLEQAETLVNAIVDTGAEPEGFDDLQASLENAIVSARASRVVSTKDLVPTNQVTPRYPRRAQERGDTGWVDLFFTVTPSGETADITIRASEPGSIFDKAAIDAVEQWSFEPVVYRGQVISQRAGARLIFRIE